MDNKIINKSIIKIHFFESQIIQKAIWQIFERIFDKQFKSNLYGFRPKKNYFNSLQYICFCMNLNY